MIEDALIRLTAAGTLLFGAVSLVLLVIAVRALLRMRPDLQEETPTEYSLRVRLPSRPTRPADIAGVLIIAGVLLTLTLMFGIAVVRRVATLDGHDAMWLTSMGGQILIISLPIGFVLGGIAVLWRSAILTAVAAIAVLLLAAFPGWAIALARSVYRALGG